MLALMSIVPATHHHDIPPPPCPAGPDDRPTAKGAPRPPDRPTEPNAVPDEPSDVPPPVAPSLAELERHVANGAAARAAGDLGIAAAAYLTAAHGYAALDEPDAAVDACLRGLAARPGDIDIHFLLTVLYLRRGWNELAVQRALLIERRLDIDDDAVRRGALGALARDFRARAPELERLASAAS